MIKVENIEVYGWEAAIRGMRNPKNSWAKSDSDFWHDPDCGKPRNCSKCEDFGNGCCGVGKNDIDLMNRLYKAGTEHRKYLRMITVTMDITAPLYWWKEYDTYKVGTVANSCSTMHKIHDKAFTLDDFSHEHLMFPQSLDVIRNIIDALNYFRDVYINGGYVYLRNGNDRVFEPKSKEVWWQMIQLLPSSYNQRRTVQMSYENVMAMIKQRENHKLDEWVEFVGILKDLPYVREITGKGE